MQITNDERLMPQMIENLQYISKSKCEVLIDYYKNNGTLESITTMQEYQYNGKVVRLGNIISTLRYQYGKGLLSDEQVQFLNKLGMKWKYDKFEPLEAYYKQHGTIEDVKQCEIYSYKGKDVAIGQLIYRLRREYVTGKLSESEIERLEQMGMVWSRDKMAVLRDYYKEHGTLGDIKRNQIYNHKGKDVKIGWYISYFRGKYHRGALSKDRIDELTEMGFNWHFDKLEVVEAYYQQFGNIDISKNETYTYLDSKVNIGNMLKQLRLAKDKGLLTQDEIKRLERMGIKWPEPRNLNSFDVFEAYYKEHGTLEDICVSTIYNYNGVDVKIGVWVANLRRIERRRSLTDKQIERLNEMGFLWDAKHRFENHKLKPKDMLAK